MASSSNDPHHNRHGMYGMAPWPGPGMSTFNSQGTGSQDLLIPPTNFPFHMAPNGVHYNNNVKNQATGLHYLAPEICPRQDHRSTSSLQHVTYDPAKNPGGPPPWTIKHLQMDPCSEASKNSLSQDRLIGNRLHRAGMNVLRKPNTNIKTTDQVVALLPIDAITSAKEDRKAYEEKKKDQNFKLSFKQFRLAQRSRYCELQDLPESQKRVFVEDKSTTVELLDKLETELKKKIKDRCVAQALATVPVICQVITYWLGPLTPSWVEELRAVNVNTLVTWLKKFNDIKTEDAVYDALSMKLLRYCVAFLCANIYRLEEHRLRLVSYLCIHFAIEFEGMASEGTRRKTFVNKLVALESETYRRQLREELGIKTGCKGSSIMFPQTAIESYHLPKPDKKLIGPGKSYLMVDDLSETPPEFVQQVKNELLAHHNSRRTTTTSSTSTAEVVVAEAPTGGGGGFSAAPPQPPPPPPPAFCSLKMPPTQGGSVGSDDVHFDPPGLRPMMMMNNETTTTRAAATASRPDAAPGAPIVPVGSVTATGNTLSSFQSSLDKDDDDHGDDDDDDSSTSTSNLFYSATLSFGDQSDHGQPPSLPPPTMVVDYTTPAAVAPIIAAAPARVDAVVPEASQQVPEASAAAPSSNACPTVKKRKPAPTTPSTLPRAELKVRPNFSWVQKSTGSGDKFDCQLCDVSDKSNPCPPFFYLIEQSQNANVVCHNCYQDRRMGNKCRHDQFDATVYLEIKKPSRKVCVDYMISTTPRKLCACLLDEDGTGNQGCCEQLLSEGFFYCRCCRLHRICSVHFAELRGAGGLEPDSSQQTTEKKMRGRTRKPSFKQKALLEAKK